VFIIYRRRTIGLLSPIALLTPRPAPAVQRVAGHGGVPAWKLAGVAVIAIGYSLALGFLMHAGPGARHQRSPREQRPRAATTKRPGISRSARLTGCNMGDDATARRRPVNRAHVTRPASPGQRYVGIR
jgi:hypothetical protein